MKQAYELLEEARQLVADKDNKITIAKLAAESEIRDPTLRNLLKPGTTNKTLDILGKLDAAIEKICKEIGKERKPIEKKAKLPNFKGNTYSK